MTVQTFLNSVLRLLNVLGGGAGETPTTEESNDALEGLNALVNEWNAVRPAIFAIKNYTHALVANQATYQIGVGATDFNTARPVKISAASVIHSNGVRTPLQIATTEEWNAILSPNAADTVPLVLYCDYQYPLANISLNPKPTGTPTLNLFLWQDLTGPLGLTDTVAWAPGYESAFRFNLAIDLAMQWGRPISDDLRARAIETKQEIGRLNESNKQAVDELPGAPAPAAQ